MQSPLARGWTEALARAATRPALFARTTAPFWDDPYISEQMLAAHLDPSHDLASRRPDLIESTVAWLLRHLNLAPGAPLMDLGCGPGLYCRRFAQAGLTVTGVDLSPRSIAHAVADAEALGLPVTYRCEDYLRLAEEGTCDAATLIWCDLGALTDDERKVLLTNVYRALRPGGAFVFDVLSMAYLSQVTEGRHWEAMPEGGFWRPGPYVEFRQTLVYPEADANLSQYLILEPDGRVTPYHIWNRCFSPQTISALLAASGFRVEGTVGDLTGAPWDASSPLLGVVARKPAQAQPKARP